MFKKFSYSFVKLITAKFCGTYRPPAIKRLSENSVAMAEIIFYSHMAYIDGGFNLTYAYMNGMLIHLLPNIIQSFYLIIIMIIIIIFKFKEDNVFSMNAQFPHGPPI